MRLLSVLVCAVLTVLPGLSTAAQDEEGDVIDVVGRAHAVLEPDYVEWTVQIKTKDKLPKLALEVNDAILQALLKIAKSARVDEKDITQGLPAVEQYFGVRNHGGPEADEYKETHVERRVTFKMRDMDEFEEALDAIHTLGVVYQVKYKSSAYDKTLAKVKRDALLDAKAQATDLAGALGQKIGPAVSVEVKQDYITYRGGLFGGPDDHDWRDDEDRKAADADGKIHVLAYAYVDFKLEP